MPRKAKAEPIGPEDLSARLYEIGREQFKLERLAIDMAEALNKVKRHYADRIEARKATIKQLARDLRLACEDSRDRLLPADRKSVEVLFGQMGWRDQGKRVLVQEGTTAHEAGERLIGLGHRQLVRGKLAPDKPAVKDALAAGSITEQVLAAAGIRIEDGGEDWWYSVDREEVTKHLEG